MPDEYYPEKMVEWHSVGNIGNCYGGLRIGICEQQRYWWSIENYDGDDWEEIDGILYYILRERTK